MKNLPIGTFPCFPSPFSYGRSASLGYTDFYCLLISAHSVLLALLFMHTVQCLCTLLCLDKLLVKLLITPELLLASSCIYMVSFSSLKSSSQKKCKCGSLYLPVLLWAGSWLITESALCYWSLGEDCPVKTAQGSRADKKSSHKWECDNVIPRKRTANKHKCVCQACLPPIHHKQQHLMPCSASCLGAVQDLSQAPNFPSVPLEEKEVLSSY